MTRTPGAAEPAAIRLRRRGMRVGRLLLILTLFGGVQLAAASSAAACSCVSGPPGDRQYVEWADAVFVGELVNYAAPPQRETMSSADPAIWTFEVSAVYKGDVAARQDVVSAVGGASCGLELPHTGRFLVFAQTSGNVTGEVRGRVLYAGLCAGTRSVAAPAVLAALGSPKPPIPGARAAVLPTPVQPSSEPQQTAVPTASAAGPAPGSAPDWATVAAWSAGGLALALAAGFLLWARRRE